MLNAQKIDIVLLIISNIKEKTRKDKQANKNKKKIKKLRFAISNRAKLRLNKILIKIIKIRELTRY